MAVPCKEFSPGKLAATPGVLARIDREVLLASYVRHLCCDWGDLSQPDQRENDRALTHGGRLLSAYHDRLGQKFWIITEADRSATTFLLPEEY